MSAFRDSHPSQWWPGARKGKHNYTRGFFEKQRILSCRSKSLYFVSSRIKQHLLGQDPAPASRSLLAHGADQTEPP